MSKPEKLNAERLAEIQVVYQRLTGMWGGNAIGDLLAHCYALAADNQVLRDALEHYLATSGSPLVARTALEKVNK